MNSEGRGHAGGPLPPSAESLGLAPETALCVDLDGTLVKSDTLVDTVLLLVRQQPLAVLHLPSWLMQGKAALKREVAARAQVDVEHLPYNRTLLSWLRREAGSGRLIYLATAADRALAERGGGLPWHLQWRTGFERKHKPGWRQQTRGVSGDVW